ncbi:hypothetical protein GCM10008957_36470 [Deinococcus ruber]|uniref:Uncharacterized protein n=2 Tax=Deinococcus ruber TaxID=1848197 RepID=A0A918CG76_9DEIO|nr:hypothetical protein GCM10008957_36470 [Deinococcus ruber]
MGSSDGVYVLFASFTQASVSGRGALKNGQFFLNIPDNQPLHLKAFEACDGVKPSQPIKVYQTETILLYSQALNRTVGPLLQADAPKDPTRVVRWLYSSGNATVLGRCNGVNTRYDLTLHQGWNAVLAETQKDGIGQLYTNVREQLPYWLSGDFRLDRARSTLPAAFFEVPRTTTF